MKQKILTFLYHLMTGFTAIVIICAIFFLAWAVGYYFKYVGYFIIGCIMCSAIYSLGKKINKD